KRLDLTANDAPEREGSGEDQRSEHEVARPEGRNRRTRLAVVKRARKPAGHRDRDRDPDVLLTVVDSDPREAGNQRGRRESEEDPSPEHGVKRARPGAGKRIAGVGDQCEQGAAGQETPVRGTRDAAEATHLRLSFIGKNGRILIRRGNWRPWTQAPERGPGGSAGVVEARAGVVPAAARGLLCGLPLDRRGRGGRLARWAQLLNRASLSLVRLSVALAVAGWSLDVCDASGRGHGDRMWTTPPRTMLAPAGPVLRRRCRMGRRLAELCEIGRWGLRRPQRGFAARGLGAELGAQQQGQEEAA